MTRPELVRIAERFWVESGFAPSTAPSMEQAASWAIPVRFSVQPDLSIRTIQRWVDDHGLRVRFEEADRPLRGCAVASLGHGLVFVDQSDPADEREFTVAHEVAHLLLDYFAPREFSQRLIGPAGHAVFDGTRAATHDEHLAAALSGHALLPFIHLLARDATHGASAAVLAREALADELACELLAPTTDVLHALPVGWDQAAAQRTLTDSFTLPPAPAAEYARRLVRRFAPSPTFVDWLG